MTTPRDPGLGCAGIPTEGKDTGQPASGEPGCPAVSTQATHQDESAEVPGSPVPVASPASSQPDLGHAWTEANAAVAQYRSIAAAAMSDAELWLRQGGVSRAIPEAMPDAILVTDEAGIVILVNSALELMFGYHRSEVIGNPVEMLLPEAARACHVEQRRVYAEEPRIRALGERLGLSGRRKNGTEFRVRVKLGPIVIPSGIYTIAVIRGGRK